MKLVDKKTKKAINKIVKKAVRKNGQTLIAGLLGGLASTLATLAKTEAADGGGKSNLGMLAENMKEALEQQLGGKQHRGGHEQGEHHRHQGHRGHHEPHERKKEVRDPVNHNLVTAPS